MKKNGGEIIPSTKQNVGKALLFLFVLLLFIRVTGGFVYPEARVSTVEEIRVGLKSKFANKQSITLHNTELELGFCNGREYSREMVLVSKDGVTVTPEKSSFFAVIGTYTPARAEEVAAQLRKAGIFAYAVCFSKGKAGVYLPVEENGAAEETARRRCEAAAEECNVTLENAARKSAYLIRIDAGERVLFADGAEGAYPQFAATEENEDGIFAVDLGDFSYRGRIEVGRYGGRGAVTAVNVVSLEEYLYGVVPCEMPASWHMEALKAQAVCARSYAMMKAGYHAETDIKRGFRMVDTTQSQVYRGIAYEQARSNAAVDATKGKTLCYENRTVSGYYFAASGGHTENAEDVWDVSIPYLQGVPDIYELTPSKKAWTVTLDTDELEKVLRLEGEEVGTIKKVTQEITTSSGRVPRLRIIGSRGSVTLATDALRNVLEFASTKFKVFGSGTIPDSVTVQGAAALEETAIHDCYVISGDGEVRSLHTGQEQYVVLSGDNLTNFPSTPPEGGEYLFAGMGHGHGVGMSQSGAHGMAKKGFSYTEILKHYFTGITIR